MNVWWMAINMTFMLFFHSFFFVNKLKNWLILCERYKYVAITVCVAWFMVEIYVVFNNFIAEENPNTTSMLEVLRW